MSNVIRPRAAIAARPLPTREISAQPVYRQPAATVVAALGSDRDEGLGTGEAEERLRRYGKNELPAAPPLPAWRRFVAQFANPLTILLLAATVISLVAWWIERESTIPFETITIVAIVLLNALLGFVQEARAEQAVAALRAMAAATSRVLRDGEQKTLPSSDVVVGDIVLLEEGDTIPADARVVESIALRVAEAALTGESSPVSKTAAPVAGEAGIADQVNMVFSGTAVAAGRGRAVVTTTGTHTEIGRIASTLQQATDEQTPLQRELDHVGRVLGLVVIAIAVVMSATIVLVDRVSTLTELVDVLLLAVSLAVAAVPEGLTAITTIVLSLGMQRMAARHVIVRKLAAVETLGSTTVICTDKTGTLTKNEMTVRTAVTASGRVTFGGSGYSPEGDIHQLGHPIADPMLSNELRLLLSAASLANNATLHRLNGQWTIQGDPTEGALLVAARKLGLGPDVLDSRFARVAELPFSSERKLMSTAHTDAAEDRRAVLATKGAPDILLARCTHEYVAGKERALGQARRAMILATVEQLAGEALRTLGVSYRRLEPGAAPNVLDDAVEQELVWLGVVGMIDPPRPEAGESVRRAQEAGIRVIMITGDHPKTAAAIAAEIGILRPGDRAMTGTELQRTGDAELRSIADTVSVYARVAPEHKLRIVQALRTNRQIVAMTGDGVNDAPALKTADIGVAMGITGTDVAKGAADMILTDDNFASIVAAVEEGRSILANIQKFLRYLLSSNIGEVLVMFLGVVLAEAIGLVANAGARVVVPLLATQILWINLLTDAGPALALGLEPVEQGVMSRPPRSPKSRVIRARTWVDMAFVGVIMATGTLFIMDWALPGGLIDDASGSMAYAQTMAFSTLVFFQLVNVFASRFEHRSTLSKLGQNRWLWLAVLLSLALQIAVVYLPFLRQAFRTVPLTLTDWLVCIGVSSLVLWLSEIKKLVLHQIQGDGRRDTSESLSWPT